jgi:DNA-binding response OmpR family regulator
MAVFENIKILWGKKKPHESHSKTSKKKILIVEDEPILQEMYKDKFIKEDFEVFTADHGEEGLKKAIAHKPDIVLLDLMMPVMDGKVMLRKLREIPQFKHLPVIILTNAGGFENIQETKHFENACEFLIKSNVSAEDILKEVNVWI